MDCIFYQSLKQLAEIIESNDLSDLGNKLATFKSACGYVCANQTIANLAIIPENPDRIQRLLEDAAYLVCTVNQILKTEKYRVSDISVPKSYQLNTVPHEMKKMTFCDYLCVKKTESFQDRVKQRLEETYKGGIEDSAFGFQKKSNIQVRKNCLKFRRTKQNFLVPDLSVVIEESEQNYDSIKSLGLPKQKITQNQEIFEKDILDLI